MAETKDKYSLWIAPDGEALKTTEGLVNEFADLQNAPRFVPHLTLIANLFTAPSEQTGMIEKLSGLAQQIRAFKVRLDGYGYKDEEFRCLYLLAYGSDINKTYETIAKAYPQVSSEHFMALPHMSVMYGLYSDSAKEKMIAAHPFAPIELEATSMQLLMTNGGPENWRLIKTFPFAG